MQTNHNLNCVAEIECETYIFRKQETSVHLTAKIDRFKIEIKSWVCVIFLHSKNVSFLQRKDSLHDKFISDRLDFIKKFGQAGFCLDDHKLF